MVVIKQRKRRKKWHSQPEEGARPEKETQKGKMKNPKILKFKRFENVKSNNRIIQKSKVQICDVKYKVYAAFDNNICKPKISFLFI